MQPDAELLERPLHDQAVYGRALMQELLSAHRLSAPPQEELFSLIEGINSFFLSQGVAPLTLQDTPAVAPGFAEALLERMNTLTHQLNPFTSNHHLPSVLTDSKAHHWLAGFYEHISDYLLATHTPINRKNVSIQPDSASTASAIQIWKYTKEETAEGSRYHMEPVDAIDFSRKTVLCFGGTAAIHGHEQALGGLIRIAEEKLGDTAIHEEGMELYGISYPTFHRPYFFADTHRYNSDPESYYNATARDCIHKLVFPLLEEIAHPDETRLKQLFGQLNFFAYSYGTIFVQQLRNCLEDLLKGLGYDSRTIEHCFAEAYAMHIGATCRLDITREAGNFSSVYIVSPEDLSVASKTSTLPLIRYMEIKGQKVHALSNNELLILSGSSRNSLLLSDPEHKKKMAQAMK